MRFQILFLFATAILFLAPAASAVSFSASIITTNGSRLGTFGLGDEITIDIRVSADDEEVWGIGASVFAQNEGVLEFVSGEAVSSLFHGVAIPGVGAFSGLTNIVGGTLVESSIGTNVPRVQILAGFGLLPSTAQALDPGLDGVVGGHDAQFRVTYRRISREGIHLKIGTSYEGDAVILEGGVETQAIGLEYFISPIPMPEPGTALLLGLGLAGLSATRRQAE
ncbi:MAG: PEP-CTERM sorting domain-containing protein [Myxococcota bacterium]